MYVVLYPNTPTNPGDRYTVAPVEDWMLHLSGEQEATLIADWRTTRFLATLVANGQNTLAGV